MKDSHQKVPSDLLRLVDNYDLDGDDQNDANSGSAGGGGLAAPTSSHPAKTLKRKFPEYSSLNDRIFFKKKWLARKAALKRSGF